jgi:cytochrome c peroxidase
MLPLTPRQSRQRRIALIASGLVSVGVLSAFLLVPLWDAGAGGLERGERARAAARGEVGRERRSDPKSRRPDQDRDASPSHAGKRSVLPRPTDVSEPVAVPVPRDPALGGRAPPLPPLPSRAAAPRLPLPVLPPPDPKLSEPPASASGVPVEALKSVFRRPAAVSQSVASNDVVALGARLFAEKKLSADHRMSCATCHDPAQSFADGRRKARGNKGQDLPRNTPALWNLADASAFYWDGRSPTLEAQIKDAIERDGEMDATLEAAVVWLRRDATYVAQFNQAFRRTDALSNDTILAALAAYERTLVSPETRFDRWIGGDFYALSEREVSGLRLFTGKARCLACHGGWRFTDDRFHDIGLRSRDPGRQAVAPTGPERAFKTPPLREAVWSAPYMHDGSLKTLEEVVAHYAGNLENRASLAPELKRGIVLSESERADLVAFLKTLSSDRQPRADSR